MGKYYNQLYRSGYFLVHVLSPADGSIHTNTNNFNQKHHPRYPYPHSTTSKLVSIFRYRLHPMT